MGGDSTVDLTDPVREWKIVVVFDAAAAEADGLYDRLMYALADLFGCAECPAQEFPRFGFAGMRPVRSSRLFALRWALSDLWSALKRGEVR